MIIKKQTGFVIYIALILVAIAGLITPLLLNQLVTGSWIYQSFHRYQAKYSSISAIEDTKYLINNLDDSSTIYTCAGLKYNYQSSALGLNYSAQVNNYFSPNPKLAYSVLSSGLDINNDSEIIVSDSSILNPFGVVKIGNEKIYYKYNDVDTNRLLFLTRGFDNTLPKNHSIESPLVQYNCIADINGQVPGYANLSKTIIVNLELDLITQNGSSYMWNYPNEKQWNKISRDKYEGLNDLSLINFTFGWAVGNNLNDNLNIQSWNLGSLSWTPIDSGLKLNQNLNAVSTVSSNEAWAVGVHEKSNYTLLKYQAGKINNWCLVSTKSNGNCEESSIESAAKDENKTLYTIKVLDTNFDGIGDFGFAAGGQDNAVILQYNATTKQWLDANTNIPNTSQILDISIITNPLDEQPLEAFAVGKANKESGIILRWDAKSNIWQELLSTSAQLNSISMLDLNNDGIADFGMAVGQDGLVLIYNGDKWAETVITDANLKSVRVNSTSNAWIIGNKNNIFHYNGIDFRLMSKK